ncbi:SGNH/GDSL hydrolase family protein [Verrucomicrobiota bacterium]
MWRFDQKKRKKIQLALLVTISLFVSIAIIEFLLRSFFFIDPPGERNKYFLKYAPSLFSRHVLAKEERIINGWDNSTWYINSKGYRGPSFPEIKEKGTIRIIFYGGSTVFNSGSPRGKDWPHQVEAILKSKGLENIEVINAGIPGHASFDSFGSFFSEGHTFNPDYVVLYNAWNDIKLFGENDSLSKKIGPYISKMDPRINYNNRMDGFLCEKSQLFVHLREIYYWWKLQLGPEGSKQRLPKENITEIYQSALDQYKINLQMFVDLARNIKAEPVLMTQARLVSPYNTSAHKNRIRYDYQLMDHDLLCEAFAKVDEITKEVAKEKNVLLIDASAHLTGKDLLFRDHSHLTNIGAEKLAELAAAKFVGWLNN